jgi:hypothetical protein
MENYDALADQSLVKISDFLDQTFKEEGHTTKPGQWVAFEPETITLDLTGGDPLPAVLLDKIELLQTLNVHPELFFQDPIFFCFSCDVISNNPVDFTTFVMPTSLEMVAGIYEVKELLSEWKFPEYKFSEGMQKAVAYLLKEEGFSEPIEPFDFIPKELFTSGQLEEDTDNKRKAIKAFENYLRTRK